MALCMPQAADTMAAEAGKTWSGVTVEQITAADFRRVDIVLLQQCLEGASCHIGHTDSRLLQYSALLDTDATHYPFVAGIDHTAQFVISQHIIGQIRLYSRNCGSDFLFFHSLIILYGNPLSISKHLVAINLHFQ